SQMKFCRSSNNVKGSTSPPDGGNDATVTSSSPSSYRNNVSPAAIQSPPLLRAAMLVWRPGTVRSELNLPSRKFPTRFPSANHNSFLLSTVRAQKPVYGRPFLLVNRLTTPLAIRHAE